MLQKSTMLGTKRKIPRRYELNWNDYRLHHNLPNSKINSSKGHDDSFKSKDEEEKEEE